MGASLNQKSSTCSNRMLRPACLPWISVSRAWLSKASSTCLAVALGCLDRYSAAAPVTCGVAIDVPDLMLVPPFSLVDTTFTPGAQMSTQGPKLLDEASLLLLSTEATVMM